MTKTPQSSVTETLRVLEITEANLEKAERLLDALLKLIPGGISFGTNPEYEGLCRRFADVVSALPAIDGFHISARPVDLNELAQWRLDAMEIGEASAQVAAEEAVTEPGRSLSDYRYRLGRKRRTLIRSTVTSLIHEIEAELKRSAVLPTEPANASIPDDVLLRLRNHVKQIGTLLGSKAKGMPRWEDLHRHLHFGMISDLDDIRRLDWPAVRPAIEHSLFGEDEAIPVPVADLNELVPLASNVPVPTALAWDRLTAEDFERLIYALVAGDEGYQEAAWPMNTTAADRGRDISAYRVTKDSLSGIRRERIIVQCKHWLARSVGVAELAVLKEQVRLWEPPRVDVLIIATTGRFSADAVNAIERQNQSTDALRIEMWSSSHLERLLAERPALIGDFGLRP